MIFSVVLAAVAAVLNAIPAVAARAQARADGHPGAWVLGPQLVYGLAALAFALASWLRATHHEGAGRAAILVGAAAALAAPLWYGHGTGQFHLSHHLVRLAVVAVVVVLFWVL